MSDGMTDVQMELAVRHEAIDRALRLMPCLHDSRNDSLVMFEAAFRYIYQVMMSKEPLAVHVGMVDIRPYVPAVERQ